MAEMLFIGNLQKIDFSRLNLPSITLARKMTNKIRLCRRGFGDGQDPRE